MTLLVLHTEVEALRKISAKSIANFFWEQIYCQYGCIQQIVTDNGSETKGAFEELVIRCNIPHVRISPYSSPANGVVERYHNIF